MAVWFVTGAGRGLGLEIARAALRAGHDVVVGARDPGRLPADLAGDPTRVLSVRLDITDAVQTREAVDQAVGQFGPIDVLVNNAGRGLLGALEEITDAEAHSLFDVNVFGLITMTRAVIPLMRAAGSGKLVHIGSSSGIQGAAGVSIYCASKFAVAGISESLAAELAPFGIQSMVVEPGAFRTDFLDPSSLQLPAQRRAEYDGTPAHTTLDWVKTGNHTQIGDPVKAAALIVQVVDGKHLPLHLPLGADALQTRAAITEQLHGELEPWTAPSLATAWHPGGSVTG